MAPSAPDLGFLGVLNHQATVRLQRSFGVEDRSLCSPFSDPLIDQVTGFAVALGQFLGQKRGGPVALLGWPSSRIAVFQCVAVPLVAQISEMAVRSDRLADGHKSFIPKPLDCVP